MHGLFLQNINITRTFQKVLGESNLRKKLSLKEMYLTSNEGKSIVLKNSLKP